MTGEKCDTEVCDPDAGETDMTCDGLGRLVSKCGGGGGCDTMELMSRLCFRFSDGERSGGEASSSFMRRRKSMAAEGGVSSLGKRVAVGRTKRSTRSS